jgi:hypothetical protein
MREGQWLDFAKLAMKQWLWNPKFILELLKSCCMVSM